MTDTPSSNGHRAGNGKVRVAIVGLGFGAEFIPIYQAHPNAEMYAICRRNKAELDLCGDQFNLHETKMRKAFDAVRRKLSEMTRR